MFRLKQKIPMSSGFRELFRVKETSICLSGIKDLKQIIVNVQLKTEMKSNNIEKLFLQDDFFLRPTVFFTSESLLESILFCSILNTHY